MSSYIDKNIQDITHENSLWLTLHYKNGRIENKVTPRCLFPVNKPNSHIRFVDEEGQEIGILERLNSLNSSSYKSVVDILKQYYFIPKITEILDITEEYGVSHWNVVADKGPREFDVISRSTDIHTLPRHRVLIRDSDNNRYEIADYTKLSEKSRQLLEGET